MLYDVTAELSVYVSCMTIVVIFSMIFRFIGTVDNFSSFLLIMFLIRSLSPYSHTYCHTYYCWYSITHSLSNSRLKSFLFCKSSLPQPFLFFSFGIHYMDFPYCLLLLLSISVFLLFSFSVFYTFSVVGSVR